MREGTLAAYIIFQGFLNAIESDITPGGSCSNWAMCEAGREAVKLGSVGRVVATVAGHNAGKYLQKLKNMRWEDIGEVEGTLPLLLSSFPSLPFLLISMYYSCYKFSK